MMADYATKTAPSRNARELVSLTVGFACMIAYVRLVSLGFVGYLEQGTVESVDPWYLLRTCATLVTLILLSVIGLLKRPRHGVAIIMAATACAVAAAMLFAIADHNGVHPLIAVLEGVASAVLMYAWMLALSRRPVNTIVGVCVLGGGIAGLIIAGVPFLDDALALVVAVIVAFVAGSGVLLADRGLGVSLSDGIPSRSELMRVPWVTVVMVLACGLLGTAVYGVAVRLAWLHDWAPDYRVFSIAVVVSAVATLALILRSRGWMHTVWVPMTVLLALALGFACISVRETMQIALGLVLASVFCGRYLYWMIFPAMFSTLRIPRSCMAGLLLVFANGSIAVLAGDAIGGMLPRSMQNLGGVAGIVTLVLVALFATTYLLYRRAFGTVGYWRERPVLPAESLASEGLSYESAPAAQEEAPTQVPKDATPSAVQVVQDIEDVFSETDQEGGFVDALSERIQNFVSEYGLTPRETEVATLTAQGFSCAYIAEKLVVSNSTVRFHQQNIYRKFDVHSRNELIEYFLINEPSDQQKDKY